MHLTLVLGPVFILRVPSLQNRLGELPFLPSYGHSHHRFLSVLHIFGQVSSLCLLFLSPPLFLLTIEGQIDLTDIHGLRLRL